jgi:hypothetical protein
MSDVLVSVLVAAIVAAGPSILAVVTYRQRRQEKAEDWARQDLVADRVTEAAAAAEDVATQAATAARLLLERQDAAEAQRAVAADLLVAANERLGGKLDIIHTLVNSNMTSAMQAELDATVREVAMMREVVALKQTAGHEASAEAMAAIDATDEKVQELRSALIDRLHQTKIANDQAAAMPRP